MTWTGKRVSWLPALKSMTPQHQKSGAAFDSSSIELTKCCDLSLHRPFHTCRLNVTPQSHHTQYPVYKRSNNDHHTRRVYRPTCRDGKHFVSN
jgi:hypothetical protein